MDSRQLKTKVQDIAKSLVTGKNQYEQAIDGYFADDAVYQSPVHATKGKTNIEHVFALHQAFRADSKLGEFKWDDQHKTATFTVRGRYHLPVADLPWPVNSLAKVTLPLDVKGVQLQVEPDHSSPSPSQTDRGDVDDTKYQITKVSVPAWAPRNCVLALVYGIITLALRIVSPLVIGIASVVVSFFQRHPLSQGIIKTAFAAIYEFTAGVLNFIVTRIPIIGSKIKSIRAKADAAFADAKAAPNVDSAPSSPHPVEKRKPRQSGRHALAGLIEDEPHPAGLIEDRHTSASASPNFRGGKAAKAKGVADPPAVVLDAAIGSSTSIKSRKPAARRAIADEPAPAGLIEDEPHPAGLIEDEHELLIKDAPVEGLITDGPDSVSVPVSGSATATDTDSGDATSPSPSPHINLHASDGHAAKHRKSNKKKRNQKQHPNYHYSHNQETVKKAE